MFGYVIVNKEELKFREFDLYRTYYCGLCQTLKTKYGHLGQLTLTYDMTFLILLLTGLYEPENKEGKCRCIAHPLQKHFTNGNIFTDYAADMNLLLAYYKALDDWQDERKLTGKVFSQLLLSKITELEKRYPRQSQSIQEQLRLLHELEISKCQDLDQVSGCFGTMMAQIFAPYEDLWMEDLKQLGFYLGKFIYLLDAYDDMEKDRRKGNYNVLILKNFYNPHAYCEELLTMMIAECTKVFERLPILLHAEILRNILYAGVWSQFELKRKLYQDKMEK